MTLEMIGDTYYGCWYTDTSTLNRESVVYSFGVGTDITWDLEMIRRFGCTVHAFDPNPLASEHVRTQQVPPQFVFAPIGLATYDGVQRFCGRRGKVSTSTIKEIGDCEDLPVKTLHTLMRERGHDHIDILKLDIEGSEFSVIPAIVSLPIKQLLVEIHKSFFVGAPWSRRRLMGEWQTLRVRWVLYRHGFRLAKRHKKEDFTFVKK